MSNWIAPKVYVPNPLLPVGDFYRFGHDGIAISKAGKAAFGHLFGADCELLPIRNEVGEEFYVLNPTTCVDCLDKHRSIEILTKGVSGVSLGLHRILFEETRVPSPEIRMFVVPETRQFHRYTVERDGNPQNEFKASIEQNGLTGLQFVLIWDSELPDDAQREWPTPTPLAPRWKSETILRPLAERSLNASEGTTSTSEA
jgi:hypothetical protein